MYFKQLYHFFYKICKGMEFLERNKIVHGDLAARNILLHKHKSVAKVSDFGLSRSLYSSVEDLANVSSGLPVRWMAPEVLKTRMVNNKSDVWSFGVLLWEVFSLGTVPYPTVSQIDMKFIHVSQRPSQSMVVMYFTPPRISTMGRDLWVTSCTSWLRAWRDWMK